VDLATITEEIRVRDRQDSSRAIAPLRMADDACLIDSSAMTVDQVVDAMLVRVKERVR
jgi:cytidylate kinase